MRKKILSILSALLTAMLITSTVLAGYIKFSNVTFSLGDGTLSTLSGQQSMSLFVTESGQTFVPTLNADGDLTGLGNQNVIVELIAQGIPVITCTNYGGNQVPGQSYPKISTSGDQTLQNDGNDNRNKNGKTPFYVETGELPALTWEDAGCPNSNWSASIDFVFWTDATINVYELLDSGEQGNLLASQEYTCVTTRYPASVSCTPVK